MELYQKKTKLTIEIIGDGSEITDYKLPFPISYDRYTLNSYHNTESMFKIIYILNGFFGTSKNKKYLKDVINRFSVSMNVFKIYYTLIDTQEKGVELSRFGNLKSLPNLSTTITYPNANSILLNDQIFWNLKFHIESLIREYDGLVPFSLLEEYALFHFADKERSTISAKCRSIWNWYNDRDWKIAKRKTSKGMNRIDGAKYSARANSTNKQNIYKMGVEKLLKENKQLSIRNICLETKLSKNTVKKYRNMEGGQNDCYKG